MDIVYKYKALTYKKKYYSLKYKLLSKISENYKKNGKVLIGGGLTFNAGNKEFYNDTYLSENTYNDIVEKLRVILNVVTDIDLKLNRLTSQVTQIRNKYNFGNNGMGNYNNRGMGSNYNQFVERLPPGRRRGLFKLAGIAGNKIQNNIVDTNFRKIRSFLIGVRNAHIQGGGPNINMDKYYIPNKFRQIIINNLGIINSQTTNAQLSRIAENIIKNYHPYYNAPPSDLQEQPPQSQRLNPQTEFRARSSSI